MQLEEPFVFLHAAQRMRRHATACNKTAYNNVVFLVQTVLLRTGVLSPFKTTGLSKKIISFWSCSHILNIIDR